jgi:hypothetical protein
MIDQIRERMRQFDPNVPVVDLQIMDDQVGTSLRTERLVASLSAVFGGLATLLAVIGLYGVMAYSVVRRYQNIMPIVRRKPRFTTSGIRCAGRISACEGACSCRVGSTSLASFRMEPSVAFQHG